MARINASGRFRGLTLDKRWTGSILVFQILLLLVVTTTPCRADAEADGSGNEEAEPAEAVLYPFFILCLGIVAHCFLSRYAPWLPYTAVLFILGTLIGVGATRFENDNVLHKSIVDFWLPIDSELLLVAFLPGLVFSDASGQNTHLFRKAFWQCIVFAFPMVLAGTTLTALIAYYIFPYDWSFNLSMTFGSILAATDPVAVAALLDQVGAPPRLKVHIAGESLLNDGSAIVFFNIFSGLFLLELDVDGLGEDIDGPGGIKFFFRLSLGGMCIGAFFGLGLISILALLDRRLEAEENVTQVGATITIAYLCYFVADVVWGTSGVIAVVTLGVLTKAFGEVYLNDPKLMDDFWSIVEWLLNTVLFSVGGLVWGSIISNEDKEFPEREFSGKDWGYLILLYILLTVIRFGLFASVFPITKRIGLGSNWKELIFQSYGGLRGAVGISLAIFLDNLVKANADATDEKFVLQTNKLFGFIGGIAFLSLVINGVTAGPLLNYLGLADLTDTRKRMLKAYKHRYRQIAIDAFVLLLGERRFKRVSYATVTHHVPELRDATKEEIVEAAQRIHGKQIKESTNDEQTAHEFVQSCLSKIDDSSEDDKGVSLMRSSTKAHDDHPESAPSAMKMMHIMKGSTKSNDSLVDFRRLFLELVRHEYQKLVACGELVDREFILVSLTESLEWAIEGVERGGSLNDWDFVFVIEFPSVEISRFLQGKVKNQVLYKCMIEPCVGPSLDFVDADTVKARLNIEKCLAFIKAHVVAQQMMTKEFAVDAEFEETVSTVVAESESEVEEAMKFVQNYPLNEVELIISHKVSKIIINQGVLYVEELVKNGLLKEQEAGEFLEELDENWRHVDHCTHKGLGKKHDTTEEEEEDIVVEA
mmetsp:Transcript_29516/g.81122  ORF Transcript_29516/g.81122 Transcript_29516/m.81122 type:complete len:874 (+) Transcript_29516:259-2880(+)|eukprot:CAMPEP_0168727770 /NCGR_PEP_ID=MMETSP0724-20121128/5344_1 /TAXON_ID=265536 /ORGANISM="Amphiprora sp., Strain CCMP467" /LENGTH=873 /DNA_ID=CAMNT_0008774603 /DNA_START=196 /DNA_END=2817 /DNA_ORIENTATION=+